MTSVKLNNHFSIWNDFHYASENFFLARHGLTYNFSKQVSVTGGFASVSYTHLDVYKRQTSAQTVMQPAMFPAFGWAPIIPPKPEVTKRPPFGLLLIFLKAFKTVIVVPWTIP